MGFALITFVTVVIWIAAETLELRKSFRVLGGLLALGVATFSAWGICRVSSEFEKTMQTNNVAKNLTSGMVEITSRPFDVEELRARLNELNSDIEPTYHDHRSAEIAISKFLSGYGIKYRREMPIVVDDPYLPENE